MTKKLGRPAAIIDFDVLQAAAERGLTRAQAAEALEISPTSFTRLLQTEPAKTLWRDGKAEAEARTARGMAVVNANVSLAIEKTETTYSKTETRLILVVSKCLESDIARVSAAKGFKNKACFLREEITASIRRFDQDTASNLALAA